jgi:hypothetical protein
MSRGAGTSYRKRYSQLRPAQPAYRCVDELRRTRLLDALSACRQWKRFAEPHCLADCLKPAFWCLGRYAHSTYLRTPHSTLTVRSET